MAPSPRNIAKRSRVAADEGDGTDLKFMSSHSRELVGRFGLAVRRVRLVSRRTSVRYRFLFKKVVVCGHCLVTVSATSYLNIKMALIGAHLNAGIILVVKF